MAFSDLSEAFSWVESLTNFEKNPPASGAAYTLDRMRFMLEAFGNPEIACRVIHIAGSKGKGSTAAFIAATLFEAGFTTGLYTSPHVTTYRERITVNGRELPDAAYLDFINEIADRLLTEPALTPARQGTGPTTFEVLTLLGFLMFRDSACDWMILETGLGGRLDATNVCKPDMCVLTPVEMEHADILGDTIEKIAWEKAGIIKEGVPACSSHQKPEAREVFIRRARSMRSLLCFLEDEIADISAGTMGKSPDTILSFRNGKKITTNLSMPGDFQAENAALASLALLRLYPETMNGKKTVECLSAGFSRARLPGRMEILSYEPVIIIDGAHTPASVLRLKDAFFSLFPGGGILIFGCVSGKDEKTMAAILAPVFPHTIISTPGMYKKSSPEKVYEAFKLHNPAVQYEPNPEQALAKALGISAGSEVSPDSLPILITGSFYMAAEIRKLLLP